MPGTLYVVATPIGNLEDVTLRALRVLREVSLIAAEDTRRTARLLQHYSISTRTTSLHEHNERTKTASLIRRLTSGESIALVSDAGTPVISDPGAHLVAEAHRAGLPVEPIPGPNAAIAALSASGLADESFLFVGFPPSRSKARQKWLAALAIEPHALILYEAPHRIRLTLQDMLQAFGDRLVALARELTKVHGQLVIRPISAHLGHPLEERGEYTLIVHPPPSDLSPPEGLPTAAEVRSEFGLLTNNGGVTRREAIRRLSQKYGTSSRAVFMSLEESKYSGE
jgi:16S rRNA (cytidine1402-2'-O)-methyltransferase